MSTFSFTGQLQFSKTHVNNNLRRILIDRLPGVTDIEIAGTSDDRNGTDFWASRDLFLPDLSIDVKVRKQDFSAHPNPEWRADDLALETWSVCFTKPGWTRDPSKRTDYVLWYWVPTQRFFITPFPSLCCVFTRYWEEWRGEYGPQIQTTREGDREWESECVFVPRVVLMDKLGAWAAGHIPTSEALPF